MLNHDDATVGELDRASLLLELRKRKVSLAKAGQDSFLGFGRKAADTQAPGFGIRSDWTDLNDLCNRMTIKLEWTQHNAYSTTGICCSRHRPICNCRGYCIPQRGKTHTTEHNSQEIPS
jgi:hypothetical protein